MSRPPRILVYHRAARLYEQLLGAALPEGNVVATTDDAQFREELPQAEIVIALELPVDVAPLAGNLRWIQGTGSGVEGLLPICQTLPEIHLTNARGIHSDLMADYILGGMIMMQWDFPALMKAQAARIWDRQPKRPLSGLTACVIGLGPVGVEVARRAALIGMNVIGVTRSGGPVEGVERIVATSQLVDFLPECDFVVLTVPATDETRGLIGARELGAMKREVVIVNVSRGVVIEEPELIAALERQSIRGAVLDVFAREPLPKDSPLWSLPNVILTPHISGMATNNEERFIQLFIDNLKRYRAGLPLRNSIDIGREY